MYLVFVSSLFLFTFRIPLFRNCRLVFYSLSAVCFHPRYASLFLSFSFWFSLTHFHFPSIILVIFLFSFYFPSSFLRFLWFISVFFLLVFFHYYFPHSFFTLVRIPSPPSFIFIFPFIQFLIFLSTPTLSTFHSLNEIDVASVTRFPFPGFIYSFSRFFFVMFFYVSVRKRPVVF